MEVQPTLLSGVPIKVIGTISFNFNVDGHSDHVWIQEDEKMQVSPAEVDAKLTWEAHAVLLPISINLSSEHTTVKVGTAIWVEAVTTNMSLHRVGIGFLPGPYEAEDFSVILQIRDSQNQPVGPEKVDQHACAGTPNCRVEFLESRFLKPGESAKDHFLIDEKYDLSRPGTYTVQVVRRDKSTDLSYLETARSNILTFTVTQ